MDPPAPTDEPTVVTWTERERVAGASAPELAAGSETFAFVNRRGLVLEEGRTLPFAGFTLTATAYRPIPYATPAEALRKTLCAIRAPVTALRRVSFALRRPDALPLAVAFTRRGRRVVLLGQALHRFVPAAELSRLVTWAGAADVAIAGTDYDDEVATGEMLHAFDARVRVLADLTGPIRRELGLPVRPLDVALAAAPVGTISLSPGEALVLRPACCASRPTRS